MSWRWRAVISAALLVMLCLIGLPEEPSFRACGFQWLTGRPCPFCGLTHGVFALAKGHWSSALHSNALSPLGFVMLFSVFWEHPLRNRLWTAGLAAFGAYGLWRLL